MDRQAARRKPGKERARGCWQRENPQPEMMKIKTHKTHSQASVHFVARGKPLEEQPQRERTHLTINDVQIYL